MIRALLKKQLQEVGYLFFRPNKKTGKKRSKGGAIALIVVLVAYFAICFASFSLSIAALARENNMEWAFYSIVSILSIALGVIGTAFNTYSSMYLAKDNETLLSMPIKPSIILFTRLVSVFITCSIYTSLVYVPSMIVGFILLHHTFVTVISTILVYIAVIAVVLVLTCILGWVIAKISQRLKNKSIITVAVALVAIGLYFAVYMKLMDGMEEFFSGGTAIISSFKEKAYPFYAIGQASMGNGLYTLAIILIAIALVALTIFILSRSFIKIVTTSYTGKTKTYSKEKQEKTKGNSVFVALLKREYKHLTSSANYMLNAGFGIVFFLIAPVLLIINAQSIQATLEEIDAELAGQISLSVSNFIPVVICVVVSFLATTVTFTTSTISLEGKTIWLLQSLPIPGKEVLKAKLSMQIFLTIPLTIISILVACIVLKASILASILTILFGIVLDLFVAVAGLSLNLKRNNLDWVNEAVPVKNSLPVFIMTFGGFGLSLLIGFGGFGVSLFLPSEIFVFAITILLGLFTWLLARFIFRRGPKILSEL